MDEITHRFFSIVDPQAALRTQTELRERAQSEDQRDLVYRFLHQSFKMYRLSDRVREDLRVMLAIVGTKIAIREDADAEILRALAAWGFAEPLVAVVGDTLATRWTADRNPAEPWRVDGRQLMAGYLLTREVVEATLAALVRMGRRQGFLWNAEDPLDPTDALFLEAWAPLGQDLRYRYRPGEADHTYGSCRRALLARLGCPAPSTDPDSDDGSMPLLSGSVAVVGPEAWPLRGPLERRGFRILPPSAYTERRDEMEALLCGRLLITTKPKFFRAAAQELGFAMIVLNRTAMDDAEATAAEIAAALFDLNLLQTVTPFILDLQAGRALEVLA